MRACVRARARALCEETKTDVQLSFSGPISEMQRWGFQLHLHTRETCKKTADKWWVGGAEKKANMGFRRVGSLDYFAASARQRTG